MRGTTILLTTLILAGCATGSAIVTGTQRPAIEDWESVRIVSSLPEGAEEIALVKGQMEASFGQQAAVDEATAELKRQAASVGANVVMITKRDSLSQVSGYGGNVGTTQIEVIEGVAAYDSGDAQKTGAKQ